MRQKVLLVLCIVLIAFQFAACGKAQCQDTKFPDNVEVGCGEKEEYNTDKRKKNTDSAVYINNDGTEDIYVSIRAAKDDSNQMSGDEFVLITPGEHLIRNLVNENKYKECYLKIRSAEDGSKIKLKGCWSPDCSYQAERRLEFVN